MQRESEKMEKGAEKQKQPPNISPMEPLTHDARPITHPMSYRGIPPLSFTFGASPRCHLDLGHPLTVIHVWGIPPLSALFRAFPYCRFCLGHPPTFSSFKASLYFHFV